MVENVDSGTILILSNFSFFARLFHWLGFPVPVEGRFDYKKSRFLSTGSVMGGLLYAYCAAIDAIKSFRVRAKVFGRGQVFEAWPFLLEKIQSLGR